MTSNRSGVMYRLYRILYGGPFLPKETPDSRHKLPNHDTTPQFTTPVASRPLAYLRSGLGPTLNMPSPARSGLVRSGQLCLCCITCFRNQTLITSVKPNYCLFCLSAVIFHSTPNKNVAAEHSRPGEAVQFGVNANRTGNTFGD